MSALVTKFQHYLETNGGDAGLALFNVLTKRRVNHRSHLTGRYESSTHPRLCYACGRRVFLKRYSTRACVPMFNHKHFAERHDCPEWEALDNAASILLAGVGPTTLDIAIIHAAAFVPSNFWSVVQAGPIAIAG